MCITFNVPIDKEVTKVNKNREKIIKKTYHNLLTVHDLWEVHSQTSSIIFLKELIKFNSNTDTMIKNVKLAELNINIATVF